MSACVGGGDVGLVVRTRNLKDWESVMATPDLHRGATWELDVTQCRSNIAIFRFDPTDTNSTKVSRLEEELAGLSIDIALHPNDAGYARMAEELIRAFESIAP